MGYIKNEIKYNIETVRDLFNKRGLKLLTNVYERYDQKMDFETKEGYRGQIDFGNFMTGQNYSLINKSNKFVIYNIKKFMLDNRIESELLSDKYISNTSPLSFKCSKCGNTFTRSWATMSNSKKCLCRKCMVELSPQHQKMKESDVRKFYELNNLKILDYNYKNNMTRISCMNVDGYKVNASLGNLRANKTPTIFSRYSNAENFDYNVNVFIKNKEIPCKYLGIENKEEIRYSKIVLKLKCECGNDFTIQLVHFVSSRDRHTGKCPHCNAKQSNYERLAEEWLIENNVEYIPQKRFEDCKNKNTLPFDFYIPSKNLCLEIDGEAHYRKYCTFGKGAYERTIFTDKIKNKYCEDKNIKLLRIPYWKFYKKEGTKVEKYKEILSNNIL